MALLFDSWLAELAAVVFTFLAGFYVFLIIRFQHWKKRGVPYLTPSFPFGNAADLFLVRKHMSDFFKETYQKCKHFKLVGIYQMWSPSLLINDPELIKNILVKDFTYFHDHGTHFDEKDDPLSANLFAMEGTKWRHMRHTLSPTFTSGKMKMMFPAILECGLEMQRYLAPLANKRSYAEDMKNLVLKYSTDVIATCAFGIESKSFQNPDSEFIKMGKKMFEPSMSGIIRDSLTFFLPSIAAIVKIPAIPKELADFFRGVVKETIAYRETNNVSRNDFMQLLIRMKNKKSVVDEKEVDESAQSDDASSEVNYYSANGMTNDEVTAQALVFFTGGMETSSMTISFCLHELALNQDVQERLYEVIVSMLADFDGEFTYEGVMRLPYLDNVVSETLRKYSPAVTLFRICAKDYKVPDSDIVIEKGTRLIIPVLGLHNDAQYYPDPEKFDPDRFTEEVKSQRHHYTYLPFGEGPRTCIASRFALMQVKVGLVSLLSKYRFNLSPNTSLPLKINPKSIIATVEGGINLKISPRT